MTRRQIICAASASIGTIVLCSILVMVWPRQTEKFESSPVQVNVADENVRYSAVELYGRMVATCLKAGTYSDAAERVSVVDVLVGKQAVGSSPAACVFSRNDGYRWETEAGSFFCTRDRTGMHLRELNMFVVSKDRYFGAEPPFLNWREVVESNVPVPAVLLTGRAPQSTEFGDGPRRLCIAGHDCGSMTLRESDWEFVFYVDLDSFLLRRLDCRPVGLPEHEPVRHTSGYTNFEFHDAKLDIAIDRSLLAFAFDPQVTEVSEQEWTQFVPWDAAARE